MSAEEFSVEKTVPPIVISFMLACYASARPGADVLGGWNSMAGAKAREWLMGNGLIDGDHRPTARGRAWVEYICATPLPEPVNAWAMPGRFPSEDSENVKNLEPYCIDCGFFRLAKFTNLPKCSVTGKTIETERRDYSDAISCGEVGRWFRRKPRRWWKLWLGR